jgi:translation initiation factor 2B subunit (eIF-2B alpha/beta/delta family)
MTDWRSLVEDIARDNRSGATAIAVRAADRIADFAERTDFTREDLLELSRALVAAQPSMAPLFLLANGLLRAAAVAEAGEKGKWRDGVAVSARRRAEEMRANPGIIAKHTLTMIPKGSTVLTHSASAAVQLALQLAYEYGRIAGAICTESRPQLEGQTLARDLAAAGLPVKLVVDAAAYDALARADVVLMGADALALAGVVNKIGSAGIAVAAQARGLPVLVLAARDKVWPAALSDAPPIADRDPAEVWPDAPPGVTVVNRYFDVTPWSAVTSVVTEAAVLKPGKVRAMAKQAKVHRDLLRRV